MSDINLNINPVPGARHGNFDAVHQLDNDHNGQITREELQGVDLDAQEFAGLSPQEKADLRRLQAAPAGTEPITVRFHGKRVDDTDTEVVDAAAKRRDFKYSNNYQVAAGGLALERIKATGDAQVARELNDWLCDPEVDWGEKIEVINQMSFDPVARERFLNALPDDQRARLDTAMQPGDPGPGLQSSVHELRENIARLPH